MLTYSVKFQSGEIVRWQAIVPATPSAIVGDYHNGRPFEPCRPAIRERLAFRLRKALDRAPAWHDLYSDVWSLDLYTLRGKPLGTIYARKQF